MKWVLRGALVAAPVVQIFINPDLFVNPGTNLLIDPWIYTGFFLSLPMFARIFPGTYYGSRLSVIVPGFAAHWLLPPLLASYGLHLTLLAAVVFATFRLVRSNHGLPAALIASTLMTWHPLVIAEIGWDYVDGAGVAFVMLAIAALDDAVRRDDRRRRAGIVAGFMIACGVVANLFLVVFLPVWGVFLLLRAGLRWRTVAVIGFAALAGAAAGLLAFGAVSHSLGGSWWCLGPQIRELRALTAARNPWQLSGYAWVLGATWLVLPAVAAGASLIGCARHYRARTGVDFTSTIHATYLAAAALFVGIQLLSTPVLQISYYSSYLVPLAIVAIAVSGGVLKANDRELVVAAIGMTALFALAYSVLLNTPVRHVFMAAWAAASRPGPVGGEVWRREYVATALGLIASALSVIAVRREPRFTRRWMCFAAATAVSFVAVPQFWVGGADRGFATRRFEETVGAHRFVVSQIGGEAPKFWYALSPTEPRPFKSISSTFLWGYSLINEQMPILTGAQAATLRAGSRLVLLVPTPADAEVAREPLRRAGFDYSLVTHREFGEGPTALSVVIVDLVRTAA